MATEKETPTHLDQRVVIDSSHLQSVSTVGKDVQERLDKAETTWTTQQEQTATNPFQLIGKTIDLDNLDTSNPPGSATAARGDAARLVKERLKNHKKQQEILIKETLAKTQAKRDEIASALVEGKLSVYEEPPAVQGLIKQYSLDLDQGKAAAQRNNAELFDAEFKAALTTLLGTLVPPPTNPAQLVTELQQKLDQQATDYVAKEQKEAKEYGEKYRENSLKETAKRQEVALGRDLSVIYRKHGAIKAEKDAGTATVLSRDAADEKMLLQVRKVRVFHLSTNPWWRRLFGPANPHTIGFVKKSDGTISQKFSLSDLNEYSAQIIVKRWLFDNKDKTSATINLKFEDKEGKATPTEIAKLKLLIRAFKLARIDASCPECPEAVLPDDEIKEIEDWHEQQDEDARAAEKGALKERAAPVFVMNRLKERSQELLKQDLVVIKIAQLLKRHASAIPQTATQQEYLTLLQQFTKEYDKLYYALQKQLTWLEIFRNKHQGHLTTKTQKDEFLKREVEAVDIAKRCFSELDGLTRSISAITNAPPTPLAGAAAELAEIKGTLADQEGALASQARPALKRAEDTLTHHRMTFGI